MINILVDLIKHLYGRLSVIFMQITWNEYSYLTISVQVFVFPTIGEVMLYKEIAVAYCYDLKKCPYNKNQQDTLFTFNLLQ